eukprot:CAMPEP_0119336684 /NCGR_PEP_ID=MMETSP1333-20130426/92355_1 /TAXON_ID=418940 /ORGANISM="Scyphosphaera apsteinii, Strain RCC1455" /LENGTH=123 /DNA_ID=CAMNT_0007347533 /DNA_START=3 /DNA_END=370 /DNA_ORIENTATION=+
MSQSSGCGEEYARALVRIAIAMIARQNPFGTVGFEGIERSACEALVDICTRYLRTIGTLSSQAAQHAGRSESNFLDAHLALEAIDPQFSYDELLVFSREHQMPFARVVAPFPVVRQSASGLDA